MNWDKPKKYNEDYSSLDLSAHHGITMNITGYGDWYDFLDLPIGTSYEEFYEKYLTHCKLMDSPLGRALK